MANDQPASSSQKAGCGTFLALVAFGFGLARGGVATGLLYAAGVVGAYVALLVAIALVSIAFIVLFPSTPSKTSEPIRGKVERSDGAGGWEPVSSTPSTSTPAPSSSSSPTNSPASG